MERTEERNLEPGSSMVMPKSTFFGRADGRCKKALWNTVFGLRTPEDARR